MPSLASAQANFIATIKMGPNTLEPSLFAGPIDRIMLGLKAHANTISHARLVALEETFPLTRQALGDERFNQLSRTYAETAVARACDNNGIGAPFPDFLRSSRAETATIDLAAVEWAWLQSYHAADAKALAVTDLTGLAEVALLAIPVARHPSAQVVPINAPLAAELEGLAGQWPAAVLVVRPDIEVQLVPIDCVQLSLLTLANQKKCTLGNLIALALEQAGEQAPLEPILHLISAGALVKAG
jgi:hypothetical protein